MFPDTSAYPPGRAVVLDLIRDLATRVPAPGRNGRPGSHKQPLLVVEGVRGGGKSTVLTTAAHWHAGTTPLVLVDFERCRAADAVAALAAVVERLTRPWDRRYAGLRFPRFSLRLLATDPALTGATERRAEAHFRAVLGSRRWAQQLAGRLRDRAAPARDMVAGDTASRRSAPWSEWRWWARVSGGHGGIDDLIRARRAAAVGEQYVAMLCDAFLADLDDEYANRRTADEWARNCVVLADNADTEVAHSLLTSLVGSRLARLRRHRLIDPLTIVATSRGELLAEPVPGVTEEIDAAPEPDPDWHEDLRKQIAAVDGWLRYRLPGLTEDETGDLLTAPPREHAQARHLIHLFTGGHAATTRRIVDVWPEAPSVSAALDKLGGELLDGLVGDLTSRRPESVRLAAARVPEHASWLYERGVVADEPSWTLPSGVATAMWDGGSTPSVLRRLLLRRLAGTGRTVSPEWVDAHRALADAAAESADEGPDAEPYYRLAAGTTEQVAMAVGDLVRQLRSSPDYQWVDLVEAVALAPCPHQPSAPQSRLTTALAAYPNAGADGAVAASVWQLLAGLWTLADPLVGVHRRDVHHQVAIAFDDLVPHVRGDGRIVRSRKLQHLEETQRWE